MRPPAFRALAVTAAGAALALGLLAAALAAGGGRDAASPADLRSGFEDMSRETQALQRSDAANPGMLWVLDGEALWSRKAGPDRRSCADCHGAAPASMAGVAARYPAFDAGERRPVDLQTRINSAARTPGRGPLPTRARISWRSPPLSLTSRGSAVAPSVDERLAPFRENGRRLFNQRLGQLDFACASCHDDNRGKRLGGSTIPQGHPNGYPLYRLEWQNWARSSGGCATA
jgi:sulfur-oxidizing protein SoxA